MLDSAFHTAERPDRLEVILYVDRDDVSSHRIDHAGLNVVRLIGPRTNMGAMTQACYAVAAGRYIMLANDDLVCRTAGWDTQILARFSAYGDDVALVWGNDLFRGQVIPTHPILSRTVCELLGGVCPQAYRRDYIDTHIYDVFCRLRQLGHDRLVYLPEVVFEHMHVEAGKAASDGTSVKSRKADDERTFLAWAEERQLAATRLARRIEESARTPCREAWALCGGADDRV